jgi:hypothetical protein
MQAAQAVRRVTKGQFATIRGVSPGRVSQWIAEKKIHGEALIGEGRNAQINLDVALEQLGATLDFDQQQAQALAKPASVAPAATITPEQQRIAAVKAETAEIELRQLRRRELEQQGVLIRASEARQVFGRELSELITATEQQFLPEAAETVGRQLGIDHKAVTTVLRAAFREFRAKRSDLAKSAAATTARMVEEKPHGDPADQSGMDGAGHPLGDAGAAAAG